MSGYREMIWSYMQENKIESYEEELIEKLRDKYYKGIPLSISLNSGFYCNHSCHYMAFQITRGMKYFKLVRGNISRYPIEPDGNHSWVEKDGWVYDTTDGFRWQKDIYYKVFQATPIDVYDENNYTDSWFYRKELKKTFPVSKEQSALMIELIEILETEKPHINHKKLMEEINLYREREKITERVPNEVMKEYKQFVLEKLEKQKHL